MQVALNYSLSDRGVSGSSVGAGYIAQALSDSEHGSQRIQPPYTPGRRFANLVQMLSWDVRGASRAAKLANSDIMINVANTGISDLPVLNVLHDTMVLDHRPWFDSKYYLYARAMFGLSVTSADLNVVPSSHSLARAKIRWPRARFTMIPWPARRQRVAEPPRVPGSDYVLVVASADKHKRIPMVLKVVEEFKRTTMPEIKVLLVCKNGNDIVQVKKSVMDANSRFGKEFATIEDRYLSTTDLLDIHQSAFCLASGSLDEGFCLPIVDSCVFGVPVVHTGRGAMSETFPINSELKTTQDSPREKDDAGLLLQQLTSIADESCWRSEAERAWREAEKYQFERFLRSWHAAISQVAQ